MNCIGQGTRVPSVPVCWQQSDALVGDLIPEPTGAVMPTEAGQQKQLGQELIAKIPTVHKTFIYNSQLESESYRAESKTHMTQLLSRLTCFVWRCNG